MSTTRNTPAYTADLFHANGQKTNITYPLKEAGKPAQLTADAFLAVVRRHEVTADVVRVEILDNKGNKGVVATAAA